MRFLKQTPISAPPERVFSFHELPDAFERLVPPWENVRLLEKADISEVGSRAVIEQKLFGLIPSKWIAEHTVYDPPKMFEDVQVSGPFRSWRHKHIVVPDVGGAVLVDDIEYEVPMGALGGLFAPWIVVPKLERMFEYRHKVTKEWCEGPEEN